MFKKKKAAEADKKVEQPENKKKSQSEIRKKLYGKDQ